MAFAVNDFHECRISAASVREIGLHQDVHVVRHHDEGSRST